MEVGHDAVSDLGKDEGVGAEDLKIALAGSRFRQGEGNVPVSVSRHIELFVSPHPLASPSL